MPTGAAVGILLAVLVLAVAYLGYSLLRSVSRPSIAAAALIGTTAGRPPRFDWPGGGQAALAIGGTSIVAAHGSQSPTPIASITKVMTALLVLRRHPLSAYQSGPTLTVTPAEVAVYRRDRAAGDSVVKVRAGEHLTERQALEGLLVPSGDNIAPLLADWVAGSESAFVRQMNAEAHALGLSETHYADASGVAPGTVSDAFDQVRLAALAESQPAFRQIVALPQVTLPDAGVQYNVNALLGRDGIVGIKTGSTPQAGGCFVFAADRRIAGRTITLLGAILHQMPTARQPSILDAALQSSLALLRSAARSLRRETVISSGQRLGVLRAPWGANAAVVADRSARLIGWAGVPIHITLRPRKLGDKVRPGEALGEAVVRVGQSVFTVGLRAAGALHGPSIGWRLTHP
jgi:D-alanyl-D-alanine carboxypeptidase (penicillin-binding protein 5/6)